MYIRKIFIGILMLGILGGFYFMYSISQTIFKPITAFNNEEAYIYLPSDADFNDVKKEISPLLNDLVAFSTLAKKLGYEKRVKGGKYTIRKGMNSNDIVKILLGRSEMIKIEIPPVDEQLLTLETAIMIATQIEATETEMYTILTDSVYPISKGYRLSDLPQMYGGNTYFIPWNTSAEAFRDTIYHRFEKRKSN